MKNSLSQEKINLDSTKMKFHESSQLMESEILAHIPLGSSIEQAQKIMEDNGFRCESISSETLMKHIFHHAGKGQEIESNNGCFLYCEIIKKFGVARRWQAIFINQDGIVRNLAVVTGLVNL